MSSQDKDPAQGRLGGLPTEVTPSSSIEAASTDSTFLVNKLTAPSEQILRSQTITLPIDSTSQPRPSRALQKLIFDSASEVIANGSQYPEMDALNIIKADLAKHSKDTERPGKDLLEMDEKRRIQMAAADLIADFEERFRLAPALEVLSALFNDEASSEFDLDSEASAEPEVIDAQQIEDLAVFVYYNLYIPPSEDGKGTSRRKESEGKQFAKTAPIQHWNDFYFPESIVDDVARPFIGEVQRDDIPITSPLHVVKLAGFIPGNGPLPGKAGVTKMSDTEIQNVLTGLDLMPIPPHIVANLYASRIPKDKIPRFANADEAVSYIQAQMEDSKVPVSASIAYKAPSTLNYEAVGPSLFIDKYGRSVPDNYTTVPDSTREGQALGKAMEDIQLTASQGLVPSDVQMAALGKARRDLYASRIAKSPLIQSAKMQRANSGATRTNQLTPYVSTLATNRAAARLMARSELTSPMAARNFRTWLIATQSSTLLRTSFSPLSDFPPEPVKRRITPNITARDALRTPLRAAITEQPLIAPISTVREVQREVDSLFYCVNNSSLFKRFHAALCLSDVAGKDDQAFFALNKIFATYKTIRIFEEDRVEELLDRVREYQTRLAWASEEARIGNLALEVFMNKLENHDLYDKCRDLVAVLGKGELCSLDKIGLAWHGPKAERMYNPEASRISEKRAKELERKLNDEIKPWGRGSQDASKICGCDPKLGSFRCC